ncbi:hypothetical protein [Methanococcoides burtonii]|nr:hypothetical protein [Methanococcoides burtonii]
MHFQDESWAFRFVAVALVGMLEVILSFEGQFIFELGGFSPLLHN